MNHNNVINVPLKIQSDVLNDFDLKFLKERLQYLVALFKQDYSRIFPLSVSSHSEAFQLIHTSLSLEKLKERKGFNKHIVEYRNDRDSAYFVTVLADYLDNHSMVLELEPSFDGHLKFPDIKIEFDGKPISIECKNPKKDILTGLEEEQLPMFEALYNVVKDHLCNLTVSYETPLAKDKLKEINKILYKKLKTVTGEGTVWSSDEVEISVTNVGKSSKDIGNQYLQFVVENRYSERNLICLFSRNGIPISFVKKGISVIDNIRSQLKKCSKKVPENQPLVLAIQSEYLTGHINLNNNLISKLFQPNRFTSVNGILLLNWVYSFENMIEHQFVYINNPYAKNPVTDFERLFRKENNTVLYAK